MQKLGRCHVTMITPLKGQFIIPMAKHCSTSRYHSVLTYLPVVSHTVVITPLVVKYFAYVNHTTLLSHPVYSTLNRFPCVCTLIAVVLSYFFTVRRYDKCGMPSSCVCPSVCVCLSHSGIVSKRLNVESCK